MYKCSKIICCYRWRPTELPEPLQAIECAMTLPESSKQPNPSEIQPIVCLTGPILDTHEESENVNFRKS